MTPIRPVYLLVPALVLAALAAHLTGLSAWLDVDVIAARRDELLALVEANPLLSGLAFFLIYATAVSLSFPAASVLTLLGGFLFGRWVGTFLVVLAATSGAIVMFWIARTSIGEGLRAKAGPLYRKVEKNMQENAFFYLLSLRLIPLFPFFLINILPAMFRIRTATFALATFIGIIPGTFVYANLGRELGTISDPADLVSPTTLIAFSLLGLMALLPTLYRQFRGRSRRAPTALIAFAALALAAAFGSPPSAYTQTAPHDRFVTLYDALLSAHVAPSRRNGISYAGVDYRAWRQDARHVEARQALLDTSPSALAGRNERLAYWINAYNFLTIDLIVRENEQQSIRNLGGIVRTAWQIHKWPIEGRDLSLDDIEHGIIRPMGEARIHFAINCAAISCPDLREEAYRADGLDRQLNEQVALTLGDTDKGLARRPDGSIAVSKIMDWFREDFAGGDLHVWLVSQGGIKVAPGAPIRFLAYDWTLNSR